MTLACPVGHPSGPGRHCPLCGRAYVPASQVVPASQYLLPAVEIQPTEVVAPVEEFVSMHELLPAPRPPMDDGPRVELEALTMLSMLASDSDAY